MADRMKSRTRLVYHVQELERLQALKDDASENLKGGFEKAARDGYDTRTLKIVLKLRKLTPEQRRERRALETIYLAALGMLEGEPLTDEARRRLDEPTRKPGFPGQPREPEEGETSPPAPEPAPAQPPLVLKDPAEARQEGVAAAAAGKRIYDNPYRAGDPCRAAWDEGWCTQQNSHGMDTPEAYQRRTKPPSRKPDDKDQDAGDDAEKGAA